MWLILDVSNQLNVSLAIMTYLILSQVTLTELISSTLVKMNMSFGVLYDLKETHDHGYIRLIEAQLKAKQG